MAYTVNRDKLYVGQALNPGEELRSQNGQYNAVMQSDGNFVVYTKGGKKPTWASNTHGSGCNHTTLQEDGNLVSYTCDRQPCWASDTCGQRALYLVMQNDGNLVLYGADGPLWASNTCREQDKLRVKWEEELRQGEALVSRNGRFQAIMQQDGNFVVYEAGRPLWASNTNGSGASTVVMQDDGNLVVYAPGGNPKWASDTCGRPASHLIMQDDGNLVLYNDGQPLWASGTNR